MRTWWVALEWFFRLISIGHPGSAPEVDEIFPPRPLPTKQVPPEEPTFIKVMPGPTATCGGFFTPDVENNAHIRGRKNPPQTFRIEPPHAPHDSLYVRTFD